MTVVNFPYIDAEIERMADGAAPPEHLRSFVTGDGCRLPVAGGWQCHVVAFRRREGRR